MNKYYQSGLHNRKLLEALSYDKIKKELKENGRKKNTPSGDISDSNKDVGQGGKGITKTETEKT